MELLYRKTTDGICLERCYTLDGAPVLPDYMDGMPVTELERYLFSQTVRGRETPPDHLREEPQLCGRAVKELALPQHLKKVGAYAFYNCSELKTLSFGSTVQDWGAGVFTGCTGINSLRIRIVPGSKSCFKEVLSELRQELTVEYLDEEGRLLAKLIFPEFFEDSVENTPARIIMRKMHGCGPMYRYCFSGTEFLFREYDRLFPNAVIVERPKLVTQLALYRLYWPYGLTEEWKGGYWDYLKQHPMEAVKGLMTRREDDILRWLSCQEEADASFLAAALKAAEREEDPQSSALLLDAVHRRFGSERRKQAAARTFEL